jgi:hypothetical protein
MEVSRSEGKCHLCGGTASKGEMEQHLGLCLQNQATAATTSPGKPERLLHLVVEGADRPEYWMHLEAPARTTLGDLDQFLRATWLECCGHLSAFTIGRTSIECAPGSNRKGSREMLGDLLPPGTAFRYEYDFGTTTELVGRVIGAREASSTRPAIRILAMNEPPAIPCGECGKPATRICSECSWSGEGGLCEVCAEEHECGEEMLLPVVNSPRVGQCAYGT